MTEAVKGHWGPAVWSYVAPNHQLCPNFQLILDFQPPVTEGQRHALNQLSSILETEFMADVHFIVKGEKIASHMCILASSSPVFAAMFDGNFKESLTKAVEIEDIDAVVMKKMLHFIYTGTTSDLQPDLIEQLFVAADKFNVEPLKKHCEESLRNNLNIDNVVRCLVLAHLHTEPNSLLMEYSLQCIADNRVTIWNRPEIKELAINYLDLFYIASQRMAVHS